MIGPQRLSLLDGEVLRRDYSARTVVDQLLDRLVDAFDFKIAEHPAPKAIQSSEEPRLFSKRLGEACASLTGSISAPPHSRSSAVPRSFQARKQAMVALMNEKLCLWILNASPDGEKPNPLELGWSTRNSDSLIGDDELVFHGNDEDDLPLECNYEIMTC